MSILAIFALAQAAICVYFGVTAKDKIEREAYGTRMHLWLAATMILVELSDGAK